MPRIKEEGDYAVTITAAKWTKMQGKDGAPDYMAAHFEFATESGDTMDKLLTLTGNIIGSGNNAGKTWKAVNMALLREIGLPANPVLIGEMVGKPCNITVEEDEYNGKSYLVVAWMNPSRKSYVSATNEDVMSMLGEFATGGGESQATAQKLTQPVANAIPKTEEKPVPTPSFDTEPEDEVPF